MYDEYSCLDCAFYGVNEHDYPCNKCYNGQVNPDPKEHPLLWKPSGTQKPSTVNHPSHYNQGNIECIDAMVAAFGKEAVENFCLVNAFKYVWRNRDKNGFEDIDKAIWYLNKYKELVDNARCYSNTRNHRNLGTVSKIL